LRLDRSLLLLAAPLVAASWLPWWGLLAFGLVLLLLRLDSAAEVVRVPLLLLAAGLTVLPLLADVPDQGIAALLDYAALFVPVVAFAALLHLALELLAVGRASGAAWLALALLPGVLGLAPSPVFGLAAGLGVGLLALALTALGSAGPEERPARRLTGSGRAVWNAALLGSVLAGLLALGTLALSPVPGAAEAERPVAGAALDGAEADAPGTSGEAATGAGALPTGQTTAVAPAFAGQLPGADLVLLGGALVMLATVFVLWKVGAPRFRGRRFRFEWWEVAAIAGILLLGVLLFAYGIAARGEGALGAGTGTGNPAGLPNPSENVVLEQERGWAFNLLRWFNYLAFASALVLSALLLWLGLKLRRQPDEEGDTPDADADAPGAAHAGALHRVRAAYRAAQADLTAAGLGRASAETPAEHAARVPLSLPDLAGPLGTLVAAYAPVRYGGRVTDEDADSAEAAARHIQTLSAGHRPTPSPRSPSESETP
jgi:hypothetical protein